MRTSRSRRRPASSAARALSSACTAGPVAGRLRLGRLVGLERRHQRLKLGDPLAVARDPLVDRRLGLGGLGDLGVETAGGRSERRASASEAA